ncbi:MAG: arginine--tRNA ligase, partial [Candidatus Blackburnbacteria bacterium]|nr:arginine--tRNA ligase [Candidatus Blackburnbacteria bacterium]
MIRDQLKRDLEKLLGVEVKIEHPGDPANGDFSTNIAMRMEGNPLENAKKLLSGWKKPEYIEKVEVVKPGFINFWLSEATLSKELELALKEGERYPSASLRTSGKRHILIEFAHPNTHKLFHIGHLRNITLGESLACLLESQGDKITRANYQGDVGLHIAKALWGIRKLKAQSAKVKTLDEKIEFLAKAYVAGNKAYEVGGAKAEMGEINRKLYAGDEELTRLWKETREWSLEYFDRIYKRVGTKFDRLYFESEVAEPGKKIVLENVGKVFKKDDGAIIFEGERYGLHNRVFINSVGLPTYEAKDVGLAELQLKEFNPDKIVHVVGPEQKGYFEVLFKALEELDPTFSGKEYHLVYGWVRLKTGKMSSRTGEIVEGETIIDEAKRKLKKQYEMIDEIAEEVAVGAVKYSMLRLSPQSEIVFDIDESIRLDGDSGPYLQYTFARTQSVLKKSVGQVSDVSSRVGSKPVNRQTENRNPMPDKLNTEEEDILRTFYKFPEIVQEAAENYA